MGDVSTAEARKNLADLLNKVAYTKERFVVTRRGREIAAIVPMEDLDVIEQARRFLERREVIAALEELDTGASVEWRALREELGL